MILIYGNVAIWSLYHCLYKTNIKPLLWEKRTEICIGAARGLQYLHVGTKQTIIHQNLQSTRILLDKNWVAKVAGFEFARMLPKNEPSTSSNTFVVDNAGYMAPEYLVSAKFTEKSDVYSFGVILLEVLCGRKPTIMTQEEDQVNLVRWFKTNIERGTVYQIIDPNLTEEIAPECLKEYVIVAEKCLLDEGIERPSMDDILSSLISALQLQDNWRNVEAVPRSHSNTLFDSAANVDKIVNKHGEHRIKLEGHNVSRCKHGSQFHLLSKIVGTLWWSGRNGPQQLYQVEEEMEGNIDAVELKGGKVEFKASVAVRSCLAVF
ncbi:hypothetical protein Vadar_023682 [Vaccinium darrowii]|uniref:Uncharacterized protein n=1 Tax=Vaccinium darrowii TaxID=229202 RepID=A0ACB7Y2V0_9ERIC|nr:hypothetical protein Vadar_023682 [Vaccinium darrowii]